MNLLWTIKCIKIKSNLSFAKYMQSASSLLFTKPATRHLASGGGGGKKNVYYTQPWKNYFTNFGGTFLYFVAFFSVCSKFVWEKSFIYISGTNFIFWGQLEILNLCFWGKFYFLCSFALFSCMKKLVQYWSADHIVVCVY